MGFLPLQSVCGASVFNIKVLRLLLLRACEVKHAAAEIAEAAEDFKRREHSGAETLDIQRNLCSSVCSELIGLGVLGCLVTTLE